MTTKGAKWRDYSDSGRWTHSLLWSANDELLAGCYSQIDGFVIWDTEFGDDGREQNRKTAKLEARDHVENFWLKALDF
jgi:hypothetical protein